MNSIYNYINYREYLRDYFVEMKNSRTEGYSHRIMSRELGFSSPNFLKLVMDGDRHLGTQSLSSVSAKLFGKKKERDFFYLLVNYAKCKSSARKKKFFDEIVEIQKRRNVINLLPKQYEYFSKWYNPVVRELIKNKVYSDLDYVEIAKTIKPEIYPKDVKKSVKLLINLGVVIINREGVIKLKTPVVETAPGVKSLALMNYHKSVLAIASESIDRYSSEEREINSITASLSQDGVDKIKNRLNEFKEELLSIIRADKGTGSVCQVNFQFFPMADSSKNSEESQ